MDSSLHAHEALGSAMRTADFSLVQGGPMYRLWLRLGLASDPIGLVRRRILLAVLLAWLPLLLLSAVEGRAWPGSAVIPFLLDVEAHVRLLLVVPFMIVAEVIAHRRMRRVERQFRDLQLIPPQEQSRFDAAVNSVAHMRDSPPAEIVFLALVYGVGVLVVWRTQGVLDPSAWYVKTVSGALRPSLAGWWMACISLPLFQFLLIRWCWRLFIWARFLWQVSRLHLDLIPTHPDRCGGLGFLAMVRMAFAPLLLAQGAMLSGLMANRILYAGASLPQFKIELVVVVSLMVLVVLGPLLVFVPHLERAGRAGQRHYGILAQDYGRAFERKWLHGAAPSEELLGSADMQSLADLGSSYEVVHEMRWVPFTWQTVVFLAVITLVPVLPLTLTMFSIQELLGRLVSLVL